MRLTLAECACYQFPNEAASYKCSIVRVPFGANDLVPSPEKSIMPTVGLRDIEVAYEDAGGGEAIVLLHGFPFNRSMWREQAKP